MTNESGLEFENGYKKLGCAADYGDICYPCHSKGNYCEKMNEQKHMEQGLEFDVQLTKTHENVSCENLSNADEISLKNWVFAWAADVKGTPLDSDINDLIWVIEKHIKEQAALQSPRVPVINGLDEAIASCVRYPKTNEIGFLTPADRDNVFKAARAYADLQKVV